MTQTAIPGMLVAMEVDGIEMGVLEDGTPFLTGSGLAKACGVSRGLIHERAKDWTDGKRDGRLARLLLDAGFDEPLMYTVLEGGRVHAFPHDVCTIVIEYYALDSVATNATAKQTLRILTRQGLRAFIYRSIGFDTETELPRTWHGFHERLRIAANPPGYFSVFREMSDFLLRAMEAGLPVDEATVPDISVGMAWSAHWRDQALEGHYGARRKHEQRFPGHYAQAASDPCEIWVYPIDALPAFRGWLDETYIPSKLPAYLERQVKRRGMARATAEHLLGSFVAPALAAGAARAA